MSGFNIAIQLGNLTRNPELRYTQSGTPVASFGIAVNRKYTSNDEQKESVNFMDVVTFGRQAEHVAQYIGKGSKVLVVGRIEFRQWEDNDGRKRSKHELHAQSVIFLDNKRQGGQHQESDEQYYE